ncbi:LacI family DNA-binding transcriptional regulator [Castellaniella caeni]
MPRHKAPSSVKPTRQPTLTDVAALAGVSTSAVSRTFTPGTSVAKLTRALVLSAAKKLGYRPNAIARTLSTRRSHMIGVVVCYLHNQFYPNVIELLSQLLQARGYHILLFVGNDREPGDNATDALIHDILQYQVDGILLASTTLSSLVAAHCQAAHIPIVLFNRVASVQSATTVESDNFQGGQLAARLLFERGARRIGFIGGVVDSSTSRDREAGFLSGLSALGLPLFATAYGDYDFDTAKAVAIDMFRRPDPPDAVFVANDHMAFAVMDALRGTLGLRVPEDVQVVGFDNVPQSGWGGYELTTIEQDAERMTHAAVEALLNHIEAGASSPAQRIVTPVRVVERSSTRPAV